MRPLFAGNDLFEYMYTSPEYRLTERQSAAILEQLLQALDYLHSHGFIHRNVRWELHFPIAPPLLRVTLARLPPYKTQDIKKPVCPILWKPVAYTVF